MKLMVFSLFILLALSSCKDYSEFIKGDRRVTIIPNKVNISSAEVSQWRVGPLRRQEVSKGLRIKLEFPQLEKEHLIETVKILDIDSWIIRVLKKTMITSETLDTFYVPLLVPGRGKSNLRVKQVQAGFINIYYSAAAISTRFEKFQCPAFDHQKIISEFEVIDSNSREKAIRGRRTNANIVSERLIPYSYRPFPVNAGKSMSGEYHFEIALYNAKEKHRKSNWFELHEAVKVTKEKIIDIKGCKNFKIPKNDTEVDGIRDFKFGR